MTKYLKVIFSAVIFFSTGFLFAQEIITDRPDKTESVETVGKNKFQVETGIEYSLYKTKIILTDETGRELGLSELKYKTLTAPTTLLRFGVLKNVELRLGFDFDRATASFSDSIEFDNNSKLSLNPPRIGAKVHIHDGDGYIPSFAVIGSVTIPNVGADDKQTKHLNPEVILSFSNDINDKFSLGYNLGFESENAVQTTNFFYSASLGIGLTSKLGSFMEIYGNFPTDDYSSNQNIDGGFTYLINNNVQIDIYGGLGLSEESNNFILGTGIGLRF